VDLPGKAWQSLPKPKTANERKAHYSKILEFHGVASNSGKTEVRTCCQTLGKLSRPSGLCESHCRRIQRGGSVASLGASFGG
jgi:hypothetical protein